MTSIKKSITLPTNIHPALGHNQLFIGGMKNGADRLERVQQGKRMMVLNFKLFKSMWRDVTKQNNEDNIMVDKSVGRIVRFMRK